MCKATNFYTEIKVCLDFTFSTSFASPYMIKKEQFQ